MSPRRTAMLAIAVTLLGGFIYFYEIEGDLARRSTFENQRRIFQGLEAGTVDRIELLTQDGISARFERVGARWQLTEPVTSHADSGALEAMTHALTHLPRAGTVVDADGVDQYGLGPEARIIHFVANGQSLALRIGRSTPVGGHIYVARHSDDEGEIGAVDQVEYVERYRINAFNKDLDDFRERRVLDIDAAELQGLRIGWPREAGKVEVALSRDGSGDWQMQGPVVGPADQQAVRDLVSTLSFFRADSFVDESNEEIEAALANPAMTISWTLRGDETERRLRIGFTEPAPDGGAIVEGPRGQRFLIDAARLDDVQRKVVVDRFQMVSDFESAPPEGIEIP